MPFLYFNGQRMDASSPLLDAGNRAYRYGDGLFETLLVLDGCVQLETYHFDRLFAGARLTEINASSVTAAELTHFIQALCGENGNTPAARVRLSLFRTEENSAGWVLESFPLEKSKWTWNETGFQLGLYPYARKSMDVFSSLKSASYLPYVMAARYATANGLDDVLLLNAAGKVCDSSRANVFLIKEGEIITPALHQGCVNGVMRRYVIEELKRVGYIVRQQEVTEAQMEDADEVFLTNALQRIKWVSGYRNKTYASTRTKAISDLLFPVV